MRKNSNHYLIERSKGRMYSAVLHGGLLIFIIIGLPDFLQRKPPEEPIAITVELLPISAVSNVKPSESQPAPEEKPEEKPQEVKKPSPPVKTTEAPPPPPPQDAVPLPDKEKEKKKEEKKPEPPKDKKDEKKEDKKKEKPKKDDLSAILRAVKETAQKERKDDKKEKQKPTENPQTTQSVSSQYNPTMPMTMSEKDAIMSQISKCWNVPAGAKDAQDLVVVINAEYSVDGTYTRAVVAPESMGRYQSDPFFRAAADSAIRAVMRCSPLQGLPQDKYDTWKQMELRFDPKFMLN